MWAGDLLAVDDQGQPVPVTQALPAHLIHPALSAPGVLSPGISNSPPRCPTGSETQVDPCGTADGRPVIGDMWVIRPQLPMSVRVLCLQYAGPL